MTTWIALLRGINVLGRKQVPMKTLSVALEHAGLKKVRTYIQSGNVIFQCSRGTPETLARRIGKIILGNHGFQPWVLVLSGQDLVRAAAANPFPQAQTAPTTLHLFFLNGSPHAPDLESLSRHKSGREAFELRGKVFYLYTPDGFGVSKIRERVERCLGVDATARNWRTVTNLIEMTRSEGPGQG
jgi:uncharacterized protein (DUF1697 family)